MKTTDDPIVQLKVFALIAETVHQCYELGATPRQVHSTMFGTILKEMIEANVPINVVLKWCENSTRGAYQHSSEVSDAH